MTSRYQAYPSYKHSGLEWLGDLPEHWDVKRLGQFFEERREKVSDKDYPALSVTMQGIVPQLEHAAKTDAGDNRKLVLKNDFVINSRSDRKGSSGVSSRDGSVSLISIVMTPKKINPKFAHHLLRSYPFQEEFYRYGKGIVADLWSTNSSEMKNILMPDIPEDEEEAIANFLDHETTKIDTLIVKQQQLIKLLKEKRQAVISHAVTKGLNSNAPMRESGVEWLGEVPEHWDVVPLKHLCSLLKDGTHLPPPRVDSGVPLLSVRNIIDSKFVFRSDDSNISEKDYEVLCRSFIPQQGDVLLAIVGGTIGKVAIIGEMANFHIQRSVAIFRTKKNVLTSEGLANIIGSSNFQSLLWENVGFSAQPGIYLGTLADFRFPIPSLDEQNQINRYCSLRSKRINILISKAMSAVKLMHERRTALISAAVTGKIDVRNWQAPGKSQKAVSV